MSEFIKKGLRSRLDAKLLIKQRKKDEFFEPLYRPKYSKDKKLSAMDKIAEELGIKVF